MTKVGARPRSFAGTVGGRHSPALLVLSELWLSFLLIDVRECGNLVLAKTLARRKEIAIPHERGRRRAAIVGTFLAERWCCLWLAGRSACSGASEHRADGETAGRIGCLGLWRSRWTRRC